MVRSAKPAGERHGASLPVFQRRRVAPNYRQAGAMPLAIAATLSIQHC